MSAPTLTHERLEHAEHRGRQVVPGYGPVMDLVRLLNDHPATPGAPDHDPWWRARAHLTDAAVQLVALHEIRRVTR